MSTKDTNLYQLTNNNGVIVEFISYGAKIKAVRVPEKNTTVDITIGYDSVEEVIAGDDYIGALCGRFANRIDKGEFSLDGASYKLAQNNGTNHLHGGPKGFQVKYWEVTKIEKAGYTSAYKLSLFSPDGEEGYPGNLQVNMIYALNDKNEFLLDMEATTDKKTIINLTSHPYFNLNGTNQGKIFNQMLEVNADAFTAVNANLIPTGELKSVKGTAMDLRKPQRLGDVVSSDYPAIQVLKGLDHNFVLNKKAGDLSFACRLSEPKTGRSIEVYTTQPGLQIYTGMHFDDIAKGKGGIPFQPYCGVAIEAQNFPDAPNKANFPSCILEPGAKYKEQIIYKFGF